MSKIRVVAAVLDRQELELIKEDGSTIRLKQGDVRIRPILAQVTEAVRTNNLPVDIELVAVDNTYTEFENKTNGAVKLFRVAASKLKAFFGFGKKQEEEAPLIDQTIGQIPVAQKAEAPAAVVTTTVEPIVAGDQLAADPKLNDALNQIMDGAIPASDATFAQADNDAGRAEATVMVAVVDGQHVVPHVDGLAAQMRHAVQGSTQGIENFMRRCAAVAKERNHSVDDLMKFMKRGDLAVTDAGDIVAYKVLRRDGVKGYVDCHSGRVKQKVGSYVFMSPSLVDHDRRNECSNGLHVARRQYVRGFGGDLLTIILVKPEDVIAVPNYDANKMRVCGYHIVFELDNRDYRAICGDKPLETDEAKVALARILKGDNIGVTQTVEITGSKGTGLIIKDIVDEAAADKAVEEAQTVHVTEDSVKAEAVDISEPEERREAPVDVKVVAGQAAGAKAVGSRAEQAKALYDAWVKTLSGVEDNAIIAAREALYAFKKAAKCSWEKLGIPVGSDGLPTTQAKPEQKPNDLNVNKELPKAEPKPLVDPTPRAPEPSKQKKLTAKQKKKAAAKAAYLKRSKPAEKPAKAVTAPAAPTPVVEAPKAVSKPSSGPSAQIRALLTDCNGSPTIGIAKEIAQIKKAAKKSWEKLGVSEGELKKITDQLK